MAVQKANQQISELKALFDKNQQKHENQAVNELREKQFNTELNAHAKGRNDKKYIPDPFIKSFDDKMIEKGHIITSSKRAGGMGNSFDFILTLVNGVKKNAELKVLSGTKLPQLSDVYIGSHQIINGENYKFVNKWLEKLVTIKEKFNISTAVPTLDELKKNICKPGKSSCAFLEELKAKIKSDSKLREELNNISKAFINEFLNQEKDNVSKDAIKKVYQEKLNCKDIIIIYNKKSGNFIIKDNNKIEIEVLSCDLKLSKDGKFNIGFEVKFKITKNNKTEEKKTIVRLRWKNRNGLYGPAWKLDPIEK
jgi:hypothetical protein